MPLLKELRGFPMHRVYKHHAPNSARRGPEWEMSNEK